MRFEEAQAIISEVRAGLRGYDSIPADFGEDGGKRSDVLHGRDRYVAELTIGPLSDEDEEPVRDRDGNVLTGRDA